MDTLKGKERYSMVDHIQSAEDLESLFWHIVFDDDFGKNNPEFTTELYHYTDKETMVTCILHDKEDNDDKKDDKLYKANRLDLRLTNLTKFSDKEEGRHILPVLKRSLEESYRDKEIDQAFFDQMTREMDSYVQKNNDLSDWYVFCFSRNGDCEYLKRNYACRGKKTGAVLGIQTLELMDTARGYKSQEGQETEENISIDTFPTVLLCDVIYDLEMIKAKVRKIICKAHELYKGNQENRKWLSKIVAAMVELYKLRYKSPEYSPEEETRLIVNGRSIEKLGDVYSFPSPNTDPCDDSQQSNSKYLYLYLNKSLAAYQAWTVGPKSFKLREYIPDAISD